VFSHALGAGDSGSQVVAVKLQVASEIAITGQLNPYKTNANPPNKNSISFVS